MRFSFRPPLAFWRDWLLVSGRVFARTAVALFIVFSLGWPLLRLAAPPRPCLLAQAAVSGDADDPWGCGCCPACQGRDE